MTASFYAISNVHDGEVLTGWPNSGNNLEFTNADNDNYQKWIISNAGTDVNGKPVTNVMSITSISNVVTNIITTTNYSVTTNN